MKLKLLTRVLSAATGIALLGAIFSAAHAEDENPVIKNRNDSYYDNHPSRLYTGKAPFLSGPPQEAPAPAPAPAPAAPVKPAPVVLGGAETCGDLVKVTERAPNQASLGEPFVYDLSVFAQCDIADVVVTDLLPQGVKLVKTEPEATVNGGKLTWNLGDMNRGQTKNLKVWVTPEKEGELVNCVTAHAVPRTCISTIVGKPMLAIDKSGPETALLNSDVVYNIVVKNTGNAVAKNVVVTDEVPEGLAHSSGQKTLTLQVGDLAPGASKSLPVTLKAIKRGKHCNNAIANSSNAGKVSDDACTLVVQPGLKIVKTGDKEQFILRNAKYQIKVSNTGDTTLTGVVVTDTAPAQTSVVSASGNGVVKANVITWNVGDLKAGEEKTYDVVLTSKVAGNYCNSVSVTSAQGLRESSEACTLWRGISALLLEKADDPDPIQIGETTTYTVRVTNQGTADDADVKVVVEFPAEIDPVSATNGGVVNGKTVTFPPFPRLAPKQAFEYKIVAKGVKVGDARVKFVRTSRDIPAPTTAEESTRVY